jgi:hypothetical protein
VKYIIAIALVVLVAWRIYALFNPKSSINLDDPNVGKGAVRPDKPGPQNDP